MIFDFPSDQPTGSYTGAVLTTMTYADSTYTFSTPSNTVSAWTVSQVSPGWTPTSVSAYTLGTSVLSQITDSAIA